MPKVIPKKDLSKGIWDFLTQMDQEVEDDYLVMEVKKNKIVFQSLTAWLREEEEAN